MQPVLGWSGPGGAVHSCRLAKLRLYRDHAPRPRRRRRPQRPSTPFVVLAAPAVSVAGACQCRPSCCIALSPKRWPASSSAGGQQHALQVPGGNSWSSSRQPRRGPPPGFRAADPRPAPTRRGDRAGAMLAVEPGHRRHASAAAEASSDGHRQAEFRPVAGRSSSRSARSVLAAVAAQRQAGQAARPGARRGCRPDLAAPARDARSPRALRSAHAGGEFGVPAGAARQGEQQLSLERAVGRQAATAAWLRQHARALGGGEIGAPEACSDQLARQRHGPRDRTLEGLPQLANIAVGVVLGRQEQETTLRRSVGMGRAASSARPAAAPAASPSKLNTTGHR